jgi:nucleoside-diphosphate-sugar epimerase
MNTRSTSSNGKVLVTGALGNVGFPLVQRLLASNLAVVILDLPTRDNRRRARLLEGDLTLHLGDILDPDLRSRALEGVGTVIHMAFLLPPGSESDRGFRVNLEGSRFLIDEFRTANPSGRFVFVSSSAVHGDTENCQDLLTPESPVYCLNRYNQAKLSVESHLQNSGLTWSIVRPGVVMSEEMILSGSANPLLFDLAPGAKQEFVHADDVARALVNLLLREYAWEKILMIGGGKSGRLRYIDLINRSMEALGIGPLPAEAFSPRTLQGGGWMDTEESQRLLDFQSVTYEGFLENVRKKARFRRKMLKILSPLIRRYLLGKSPYYRRKA